jgi:hypothetical protein
MKSTSLQDWPDHWSHARLVPNRDDKRVSLKRRKSSFLQAFPAIKEAAVTHGWRIASGSFCTESSDFCTQ